MEQNPQSSLDINVRFSKVELLSVKFPALQIEFTTLGVSFPLYWRTPLAFSG
jgi:hypothetical protein